MHATLDDEASRNRPLESAQHGFDWLARRDYRFWERLLTILKVS